MIEVEVSRLTPLGRQSQTQCCIPARGSLQFGGRSDSPMHPLVRLWFFAGSLYFIWWSYRLITNPFVACAQPAGKIPGRWVSDICASIGNGWAAAVIAVFGILLAVVAVWPRHHADAGSSF